jgi:hypothetical protein
MSRKVKLNQRETLQSGQHVPSGTGLRKTMNWSDKPRFVTPPYLCPLGIDQITAFDHDQNFYQPPQT